jgi:F-type H+-transporting ATPase subunit a
MVIFINIIELLVATIQAYVFTLFSSMYIGAAVAEHHHEEQH